MGSGCFGLLKFRRPLKVSHGSFRIHFAHHCSCVQHATIGIRVLKSVIHRVCVTSTTSLQTRLCSLQTLLGEIVLGEGYPGPDLEKLGLFFNNCIELSGVGQCWDAELDQSGFWYQSFQITFSKADHLSLEVFEDLEGFF